MRQPTADEQHIFNALIQADFPGRDTIRQMLETSLVSQIDDKGSLSVHYEGNEIADTINQIPVEGRAQDRDGVTINFLFHMKDGKPTELEIYKDDGSRIQSSIGTLKIFPLTLPPYPMER